MILRKLALVLQRHVAVWASGALKSALVVRSPGSGLRGSSPTGPVQAVRWWWRRGQDQSVEKPADLGQGQRDDLLVWPGVVDGRAGQDGEQGQREHDQGDVAVPAGPAANLVVIQTELALAGLEQLLDAPAGSGDAHEGV